jgi:hypothetical protein
LRQPVKTHSALIEKEETEEQMTKDSLLQNFIIFMQQTFDKDYKLPLTIVDPGYREWLSPMPSHYMCHFSIGNQKPRRSVPSDTVVRKP